MLHTAVDPDTKALLDNLINILMPILYALAGAGLVFISVRLGLKLHFDFENKAQHLKNFVWALAGVIIIFMATGIAHILLAHFSNLNHT